jgi:hypothetical protein
LGSGIRGGAREIAIGYLSRDVLAATLKNFHTVSQVLQVLVVVALVIYATYRVMQFRKYRQYDVVPRVQAQELEARLASDDSTRVQIVDVRSHGYYDIGAERIFGSIRIEPNNLDEEIKTLPKDKDIYLYCT